MMHIICSNTQLVGFTQLLIIFNSADYTEIGGDEELPLGEEFQEHHKRFLRPGEKKVERRLELVRKLVTQLA